MTGTGMSDEIFDDEQLFEAIRDAYSDVHLPVPLADIRPHPRRTSKEILMSTRLRLVLAAVVAVMVVTIGTWLSLGRGGGQPMPANPSTSASTETPGKPPRPTSSATTDAGKCADYGQASLDASADPSHAGNQVMPPLRLTLGQDQSRLLIYAIDDIAVTCWLSGDVVVVQGSATAVNAETYPSGQLSYSSEDSGHGWGGVAFGRVPAGTTKVTISFPTGPDAVATIVGEWFGYFAPAGPDNDRLAVATKVTAVTPTGSQSQQIQHG